MILFLRQRLQLFWRLVCHLIEIDCLVAFVEVNDSHSSLLGRCLRMWAIQMSLRHRDERFVLHYHLSRLIQIKSFFIYLVCVALTRRLVMWGLALNLFFNYLSLSVWLLADCAFVLLILNLEVFNNHFWSDSLGFGWWLLYQCLPWEDFRFW